MKKKLTAGILIVLAAACMIAVWPVGVITKSVESKSAACTYLTSGPIQNDVILEQEFIPKAPYLKSISIQISRDTTFGHGGEGSIVFSLFDESGTLVSATEEKVSDIVNKQYQEFDIDKKVQKGSVYHYQVQGFGCESAGPAVRFAETVKLGLKENQALYYQGQAMPQYGVVSYYQYKEPLNVLDVCVYDAWIVTIALLCYTIVKLSKKKEV